MAGTIPLWYRRRFLLPPNDDRFLDLSYGEMFTEYLAHRYDDAYLEGGPEKVADVIAAETEDPDFDAEVSKFLSDDDDAWEEMS